MRLYTLFLFLLLIAVTHAGFFDFISRIANNDGSSKKAKSKMKPVTDDKAKKYLQDFGYIGPSNSLGSSPNGMNADFGSSSSWLKRAITKFQEFAGLQKTGELDDETKTKMAEPRCGVIDVAAVTSGGAAFKWRKTQLTYSIENFSPDLPREDVRRAVREAYSLWSDVTPLEFSEVSSGGDIKIRFGTNNHNDPWPFDGKGGVLAHATMPENGALHFDDDENWAFEDAQKIGSDQATDFLAVAIHEGGHTLGLDHSRIDSAIMAPFYSKTVDSNGRYNRPKLHSDDIRSIQDIYGPRTTPRTSGGSSSGSGSSFTTQRPGTTTTKSSWLDRFFGSGKDTTTRAPYTTTRSTFTTRRTDFGGSGGSGFSSAGCPRSIDAYTPSDDFSYLFSGSDVYQISGTKVHKKLSIRDMFPSAPSRVDAAVFNPVAGTMLILGNGQVYGYYFSRIRGIYQLDSGYPKRLTSEIRFTPSGALRWINGHQIILSSGDDFAVYDEFWNQQTLTNKISSYFPNLPQGIKGIESPSGSLVTAFTSNMVYQYDSRSKTVRQSKSLSSYLVC
ncbi:unnamed protein product [Auanema sp. JU1783]|nr:unnamed protein product [Auanema sp. JU1783]